MYKGTSENLNHIERVASHSTKGSRRGFVDLPGYAKEPEEYYQSLLEQGEFVRAELNKVQEECRDLKHGLKHTLPYSEFERINNKLNALHSRQKELEKIWSEHRRLAVDASSASWCNVYYHVAKSLLTPELDKKIQDQTNEILGHGRLGIGLGKAGLTAERKAHINRIDTLRERRRKVLARVGHDKLVYSDEKKNA